MAVREQKQMEVQKKTLILVCAHDQLTMHKQAKIIHDYCN